MTAQTHSIAIVIPVYGGEKTLSAVVGEIAPLTEGFTTPDGHSARVTEVVLVHDCGRDDSPRVMRELESSHEWVKTVWLTRNFGQHAATIAGMSATTAEWVVTMDEDGQHDPAYVGALIDVAIAESAPLVYAKPQNAPSHGLFRNLTSKGAKWMLNVLFAGGHSKDFQSYRLILGELARDVAHLAGEGVYLDVALSWVAPRPATCPVQLRDEGDRASGYSTKTLIKHFGRMVLTSGTRALRAVSVAGVALGLLGVALTVYILVRLAIGADVPAGWASTMSVVLLSSGAVLFSLGVIAEYIGITVNRAHGRPAFLTMSDPAKGPLGRKAT